MGRPVCRLTDQAACPPHCHYCPVGAHAVIGPAIMGSPSVMVDGLPVLRETDMGLHAACCGPNIWLGDEGSGSVFADGLAVMRLGDPTMHCGSFEGAMVTSGSTVFVGD